MAVALLLFLLVTLVRMRKTSAGSTNSTTRDAVCRARTAESWESKQHADDTFSFYRTPSNFSSTLAPGSLLHVEPVTNLSNYSVPGGLTVSRLIYTTVDLNATVLPASAYVLWPYTTPDNTSANLNQSTSSSSGFPMVAWAHGTTGLLPHCAPSNYRNLQYHFMAPFLLALQGMAVVAPDYAGLGISSLPNGEHIGHPWLAGPAQANDLANAVLAARAAFPDLLEPTGNFVAMGHSQGGNAAWAFAQRQAKAPLPGYQGTVSIAPATNIVAMIEQAMEEPSAFWAPTVLSSAPRCIAAVTAQFPAYNYSGMSDISYEYWNDIVVPLSGCLPTDINLFSTVSNSDLAKPGWTNDSTVQMFANMTATGREQFKGPLLVASGSLDHVVPNEFLVGVVNETCAKYNSEDESLEFVTYEGVDHFSAIQASSVHWLPWIKHRLGMDAVRSTAKGCERKTVQGFRTQDTAMGSGPNFLNLWAPPADFWKYTL